MRHVTEDMEAMHARPPAPGPIGRLGLALRRRYASLARSPRFEPRLLSAMVLYALISAGFVAAVLLGAPPARHAGRGDFTQVALLAVFALTLAMLLVAALVLPHNRIAACLWLKRAVVLSLLLEQPLMFYRAELGALIAVVVNVVALTALDLMIAAEHHALLAQPPHRSPD